ncbi:hypothetical protein IEO21_08175 [Rhodonia placenta]|uniref:F-box domain-containing protein n=1 Tax=Rhodonia placenta TaxID=104341 RepID=A0A8H7TZH2_9APHY|nr:hypothetical protein IEO21_08175 [Postia placenta]
MYWLCAAVLCCLPSPRTGLPSSKGNPCTKEHGIVVPSLAIEVWERVLDHLWYDQETLKACTLVCRAWYPRARFHLLRTVILRERHHVYRLAKLVQKDKDMVMGAFYAHAVRGVILQGGSTPEVRIPVPHLATFATALAGKLLALDEVALCNAEWISDSSFVNTSLHLSAFHSVTRLVLQAVTFPNIHTFRRLICAFPRLGYLECWGVKFTNPGIAEAAPRYPWIHSSLSRLYLNTTSMGTITDLLLATGIASRLHTIILGYWEFIPIQHTHILGIQRLLDSAEDNLRSLDAAFTCPQSPVGKGTGVSEYLGPPLTLARCTNLMALVVRTEPIDSADYGWIYHLLASISSTSLRQMTIVIKLSVKLKQSLVSVRPMFQTMLVERLDELLATEQFAGVECVEFKLRVYKAVDKIPSVGLWEKIVLGGFPRSRRRILCEFISHPLTIVLVAHAQFH